MLIQDIAKLCDVKDETISNWLNKFGINKRSNSLTQCLLNNSNSFEEISVDKILEEYKNGMSILKISQKYNVGRKRISEIIYDNLEIESIFINRRYLNEFGLKLKEIDYIIYNLRRFLWKEVNPLVIERDRFKCTKCESNIDLNVHHINQFSDIISRCAKEYNLSPNNIDEFINYVKNDSEFLNINNLITLCFKCHMNEHQIKR
jgi:5-methylcytosine-specific restriction endonuclease McrA